ncbi:DUF4013 domain-containing protein [Halorarum halophilum]|uniref:DUF4013 domain-containing protein n=1 Tax=Halorarum halophilum TaxID=2743090 RepID=A0A7D5GGG9_9EURY|nr:DUF4013 domain-containing protein [Halobaculum halophilum]QLG28410.1 DUF4013 domain-containing protein [Halobaculum halophilum]
MQIPADFLQAGTTLRQFASTLAQDVRSIPNIGPTLLLGGLLWGYAVWLVIPSFLVMGFFVRILRYVPPSAPGEDVTPHPSDTPRFDRWVALVFDGVRAYVIWTVYILVAFAGYLSIFESESSSALLLAIFSSLLGNVSFLLQLYTALDIGISAPGQVTAGVLVDPALLGLLFAMYVGPAALLNFAARGTLSDGFSFSDLSPILRSLTYARNWIVFVLTWFVGTLVLLMPSQLVASVLVPVDVPILVEAVRESLELLRGFLSFAIFLVGYAALGRVSVPPRDKFSLGDHLHSRLDSEVVTFVSQNIRSGQTILVAVLLGAFWSVPSVVLLMGYVAGLVRANDSSTNTTIPSFGPLWGLIADGVRAIGLWVVYGLPPLLFLFIWNSQNSWPHAVVGNVLTGVPAFVVGSWYLARNIYNLLIAVWPAWLSRTPIDPFLALIAFATLSLLATYLYPAALVLVARTRDLRRGFSPHHLADAAGTLRYARAWLRAIVSLALGTMLLLAWNYWRERPERSEIHDTMSIIQVGEFSLINVPTEVGIMSSLVLLLVATGNVLLLLWAYYGVAMAIPGSRDPE